MWLSIARTAHEIGLRSNATMLFGHVETLEERVDHLMRLRETQDKTHGFSDFHPARISSGEYRRSRTSPSRPAWTR